MLIKPTKGSLFIKCNLNTKGNSKSENTAHTAEKKVTEGELQHRH